MFFSVIGKVQGLGKSSDQKENLDCRQHNSKQKKRDQFYESNIKKSSR